MSDETQVDVLQEFERRYLNAIKVGDSEEADDILREAQDSSVTVDDIYLQIFQPAAYQIGDLWERKNISVAQEHIASAIIERHIGEMHSCFSPRRTLDKTVVLGCVDREYHRIGLRMVADFFERDGWLVYFLGATTPAEAFASLVKKVKADLIGISIDVDYHLPRFMELKMELDRQELGQTPIMVGGLPFVKKPQLALDMGAAFSADDACQAVEKARVYFSL